MGLDERTRVNDATRCDRGGGEAACLIDICKSRAVVGAGRTAGWGGEVGLAAITRVGIAVTRPRIA